MPSRQAARPVRLEDVARAVGGSVIGASATLVSDLTGLEEAGPSDLAYIASDRFIPLGRRSRAAAFVVGHGIPDLDRPQVIVDDPTYAAARIIEQFFSEPYRPRGIAEQIVRGRDVSIGSDPSIWPFVTLGDRVTLGARVTLYPGVFLGDDCVVGDDTVLYPNVAVLHRCRLGARVIVHSGAVIGSDGFGYVQHAGRHQKIPQRGSVVIEDDVELGANVTVDVATFGQTVIGRGTKIDNLVHIAHNVRIGEHSLLVAQVGIAGSTTLGHHVMVGGQAGLAEHIEIGDGVRIAAGSGVSQSVEGGQVVGGNPAIPHDEAVRAYSLIRHLPEMRRQLRELRRRISAVETTRPAPRKAARRPRRGPTPGA
jgi:UDP-3-O-[3-hydroxymyristoyl] glucosamine N-acyltransferase